jgi:DNA primase
VSQRFPSDFLRALRNDLPINDLIRSQLNLPRKERDGFLRFLCPRCNEFHTATNPKTNLGRCFRCNVSFNPIELVMAVEHCRFVDSVKILAPLLEARRQSLSRAVRQRDER